MFFLHLPKINKLDLLQKLFYKSTILLAPSVSKEIKQGIRLGIIPPGPIRFSRIKLELSEKRLVRELRETRRLGLADAECIAIAKYRNCLLITNDHNVETEAKSHSVSHINLPLLLRELWKSNVLPKHQVAKHMKEIEEKDRVVIKNKGLIIE